MVKKFELINGIKVGDVIHKDVEIKELNDKLLRDALKKGIDYQSAINMPISLLFLITKGQ